MKRNGIDIVDSLVWNKIDQWMDDGWIGEGMKEWWGMNQIMRYEIQYDTMQYVGRKGRRRSDEEEWWGLSLDEKREVGREEKGRMMHGKSNWLDTTLSPPPPPFCFHPSSTPYHPSFFLFLCQSNEMLLSLTNIFVRLFYLSSKAASFCESCFTSCWLTQDWWAWGTKYDGGGMWKYGGDLKTTGALHIHKETVRRLNQSF